MHWNNISFPTYLRYLVLAGLLMLVPTKVSATLLNIEFGDVSVTGTSSTETGDPTCPPGVSCDFRPGARVFRSSVAISQNIISSNPLVISLIETIYDPSLSEEELVHIEELKLKGQNQFAAVQKRFQQRSRELRAKRRSATRGSIRVPDNDFDPIFLSFEWDADYGPATFLTLNVVDTVTGEFSDIEISLVPEPTTMLLLGTGLVGITGAARKRKKNQA